MSDIVMETKNLLAYELEDYEDEVYVRIDIPKACDNSSVSADLVTLKNTISEKFPDASLCIYSYTNLAPYIGKEFVKLPEDYLYKIDALGDDSEYKLPKEYKIYYVEAEDGGYFVTIDDFKNSVKDVASLDLFVYDNSMCIGEVFTEPDYRRKGLASMLITSIRHVYPELPMTLHTDEENVAACKLYEGLGFYKDQTIYNYIGT